MADAELLIDEETGEELIITATGEPPLSDHEKERFARCKEIINAGIVSFIIVGAAIKEVIEKRYFRAEYTSVEDWAKDTFDMGRKRVYQLAWAAEVVIDDLQIDIDEIKNDSQKLSKILDSRQAPKNEAQAAALLRAPKEERAAIWQKTVEKYGDKVTAKCVTNVIRDEIGVRLEDKRQKAKREPSEEKKGPHKPFTDAFDEFWRQVNAAYMDDWKKVPKKDVVKRLELILDYIKNH